MPDSAVPLPSVLALQAREWDGGRGPALASYLARFPDLRHRPELLLDLVQQEVVFRERRGDRPTAGEYAAILPELADELAVLFAVDRVFRPGTMTTRPPPDEAPTLNLLLTQIAALGVLTPGQLADGRAAISRSADGQVLLAELTRRGLLTEFQAAHLRSGRAEELVLGAYLLLAPIGAGGMGQVYKARDRELGRLAAVKVIRPDLLSGATAARFRREAVSVARLAHANVVALFGAGLTGPRPFLAMEYIAGDTFDRVVQRDGPLPFGEALEVVRQAALGLHHAHESGLTHRDVKPANLIVAGDSSERPLVKVLDFGLAGARAGMAETGSPLTGVGVMFGTPDYMAPEQFRDAGRVDHRADQYGLGCTLYFLLTGRPPFPGGSLWDKMAGHEGGTPPPVPGLPPAVARLLDRMMAKDPANRFPSAAAVAEAIAGVAPPDDERTKAGGETATLSHAPTRDSARPACRRRWRYVAGVAGCVLLAVGVVALRPWRAIRPDPRTDDSSSRTPQHVPDEPPPTLSKTGEADPSVLRRFRPAGIRVYRAAFARDGRHVVTDGEDGTMRVWNIEAGNPTAPARVHSGGSEPARLGAFLPTKTSFLAGATDGSVRLWNLADGRSEELIRRGKDLPWRSVWVTGIDGAGKVAVSGERHEAGVLRVWDLRTKAEVGTLPGRPGVVVAVAVSGDGTRALTAGGDGSTADAVYWDLTNRRAHRALKGHTKPIWFVAFSPNERFALTAGADATIRLWRLADGKELARGDSPAGALLLCAAVRPDGRRVVTGDGNGVVRVWRLPDSWDAAEGRVEPVLELRGHRTSVEDLRMDPSGTRAVSVDSDGEVIVWDLAGK